MQGKITRQHGALELECGLRALQVEQLNDKIAQLRKQYDDEVIRHTEELKTKDELLHRIANHYKSFDLITHKEIADMVEQALKGGD